VGIHASRQPGVRRSRARLRFIAVGCAAALGGAAVAASPLIAHAGGKTISVEPGDSIQAAIDSAHPGDTVELEEGTYFEQVNITKDDITLKGEGASETILKPPQQGSAQPKTFSPNCDAAAGQTGICVAGGPVPTDGSPPSLSVEGVRVKDLTVTGFGGSGMFLFGTRDGHVEDVHASNDGGYGIFFNSSSEGVIRDNLVWGNGEAGIYYGDSPDADAWISHNTAHNNGNGLFLRDASEGTVTDNNSWGNCIGILVLNTGSGTSDWLLRDNDVNKNNSACPGGDQALPTSGLGIVIASASRIHVTRNEVEGNDAGTNPTVGTGGIVVISFGIPASDNTIDHNKAEGNSTDIVWDGNGTGNTFKHNDCDTSTTPPAAC
jgi:parallel beta-helix repeat protein